MKYLSVLVLAALAVAAAPAHGQTPAPMPAPAEYVIGPQDVLNINIWDQPDLPKEYTVEIDGTVSFPFVGRIKAGGLTIRQLEIELKRLLADGFFKDPQVTVAVGQYKSKRVFIVGEVRMPGIHPLTDRMTLIEALARAGSTGSGADTSVTEVIIVRPKEGQTPSGPVLPGQDESADVIKVNIRALEAGDLAQNHLLQDGDTIFVPRSENMYVYVYGEVRSPGAHAIRANTTVMQAIALAGGLTEFGSDRRIKIIRLVDGEKQEIKAKLGDIVRPGDTIVVQERFF